MSMVLRPNSTTGSLVGNKWFWFPNRRPNARIRLFCFPYAGGDSLTIFRNWPWQFPSEIEVAGARLPGRGSRFGEPAMTRMNELVDHLCDAIYPLLDKPFALFGYSMGALISFELALALQNRCGAMAKHVIVSARRSPGETNADKIDHDLPTPELLAETQKFGGWLPEMLSDQQFLDCFVPILRADLKLCQSSEVRPAAELQSSITVFGGTRDEISEESLRLWERHTKASFRLHMFEGNHLFIRTVEPQMIQTISDILLKRAG